MTSRLTSVGTRTVDSGPTPRPPGGSAEHREGSSIDGETNQDRRDHHPRRCVAQEHPHGGVPIGDGEGRSEPRPGGLPAPPTATSTRSSFGAARTSRTGPIWSCKRQPCSSRKRSTPKVLIDDLLRRSKAGDQSAEDQLDLFADFNGLRDDNARTEFYRHDANWSNRMILGDSLQVMASLASAKGCAARSSASTSTHPTESSSTPTSSGPPPAAT